MTRIKAITDWIDHCDLVIDIGSDHAYTAIELLTTKKAKFVVNVDNNVKPLEQGIANLEHHHLLASTLNILNDGLLNIQNKLSIQIFDYAVISGIGAQNIISILKNNQLQIKEFVLQPNNGESILRAWLLNNGYSIIKEQVIIENNICYVIFKVYTQRNFHYYSASSIALGHKKLIINNASYYQFLEKKLVYLQKIQDNHHINKFQKEINFILKRIKWCRQKTFIHI